MLSNPDRQSAKPTGRAGPERLLTIAALLALVPGVMTGLFLRGVEAGWADRTLSLLGTATSVWVDLLRLLVLPLVASHLFLAIRRLRGAPDLGRLGLRTLAALLLLVILGNAIAITGGFAIFSVVGPELTVAAAGTAPTADASVESALSRLLTLLTSSQMLLATIAASVVAGVLVGMAPASVGASLEATGGRVAGTVDRIFRLSLIATPLAAFTLALTLSARQGVAAAGALLWYLAVLVGLMTVMLVALSVVGAWAASVSLRRWLVALLPTQVLAFATRSSLATVPALLEAGRDLHLPDAEREFVVPFVASTVKPSTTVSGPTTMVFLSIAFGVDLSAYEIAGFLVADALVSLGDVGIPTLMPRMKSLPLYLALGIPAEGYVLARSTAVVTDALKTIVNATGYLTAAAMVSASRRRAGASPPRGPES